MTDNTDNPNVVIQGDEGATQSVEATSATNSDVSNKREEMENTKHHNSNPLASPPSSPSVCDIFFPRNLDIRQDAIYLASFPQIILFWPTILACFLCAMAQQFGASPVSVGWCFSCVVFFNFLPFIQDFDQKKFLILVLAVIVAVLGIWIINLYGFSFFKTFGQWVLSFQPSFSNDAFLVMGSILLLFFAWGLIGPLFSYWRLEQNEFVHFTRPIGKDISIARLGCTIYKDVPDVIESFLTFGGGSLIIRKDNQIVASIENVPFLNRRMNAIEDMLSETRVVIDRT